MEWDRTNVSAFFCIPSRSFANCLPHPVSWFLTALCPDGWKVAPDKNRCFIRMASSLPWSDSEGLCRQFGGHLAALASAADLSFAQGLCAEDKNGCWVGGRSNNSKSGFGWKWSDDASFWNESISPGEPSQLSCPKGPPCPRANESSSCTLVARGNAALVGEQCNASRASICMVGRGSPPPPPPPLQVSSHVQ